MNVFKSGVLLCCPHISKASLLCAPPTLHLSCYARLAFIDHVLPRTRLPPSA